MTSSEREKYAAALGPAPEKSGRGYAVMLASIQRGEVKSIKASRIKGWGPARPQMWNSKPYWTATVTYPTTSLFGTFDTEGMAIISGNRVAGVALYRDQVRKFPRCERTLLALLLARCRRVFCSSAAIIH